MSQEQTADLKQVAHALVSHERYVVTTHENPGGDALGSALGMHRTGEALGKESSTYLAGDVPCPRECRFRPLDQVVRGAAVDVPGRVLVAVDCANERRLGPT